MLQVSTKVEPNAVVFELTGRFDFHVMEQFLSTLAHIETTNMPEHVIVDLSQVTIIDSMAIGGLVTTYQRLNQACIRLTLAGQCSEVDTALKDIKHEAMIPTAKTVKTRSIYHPCNCP